MQAKLVTLDDLEVFKKELIQEIKMLNHGTSQQKTKKWLKSAEVIKQLRISPGTLQNLRINGSLPYTRIGGLIYYDAEEIDKMLEKNKVQSE